MTDPDIFRAAKLLIDQHGEDAALRAAHRADELLEEGDVNGSAVWGRILAAVKELRRGRRDDESLNRDVISSHRPRARSSRTSATPR
jgi:hypothetical protein